VLVADCVSPECKAALECFMANKCSPDEDHLYNYYCGATAKEECFMGKAPPQGPCRQAFEAAAHTSAALDIGHRFFDREAPIGQAMQIAACMLRNCPGCP
jgi:hypothetical protein